MTAVGGPAEQAEPVVGGLGRSLATALAAGVLFASTAAAIAVATAWAIAGLLDLAGWLGNLLEIAALLGSLGIGGLVIRRAWWAERRLAAGLDVESPRQEMPAPTPATSPSVISENADRPWPVVFEPFQETYR